MDNMTSTCSTVWYSTVRASVFGEAKQNPTEAVMLMTIRMNFGRGGWWVWDEKEDFIVITPPPLPHPPAHQDSHLPFKSGRTKCRRRGVANIKVSHPQTEKR